MHQHGGSTVLILELLAFHLMFKFCETAFHTFIGLSQLLLTFPIDCGPFHPENTMQ